MRDQKLHTLCVTAALLFSLAQVPPLALCQQERVRGAETEFLSPNGVVERCVAASPIPGGTYSEADRALEERYCAIDFNSVDVALCPKTWSTSPATLVYDVSSGTYANDAVRFEREQCAKGGHARQAASAELAFFKTSMNAGDTSGTFSAASLVYYHFSRYFDTRVRVPVAVYRSVDRRAHRQRVSDPGMRYTSERAALRMIHNAWRHVVDAEATPSTCVPAGELFTEDGERIFGVLLLETGERYGPEINGTRESGWGDGQNHDFQRTAPFLALRHDASLTEAISAGLHQAREDPKMHRAIGEDLDAVQVAFWMQEVVEIVLLDYLFRQQDRIGNVDFEPIWHWVRDGKVETRKAVSRTPPPDIEDASPLLLRRTWLNDNDAGVRETYTGFAERTGMLDRLHHYNAGLYRRLQDLARDLSAKGDLYQYLADAFGLTSSQVEGIVERTEKAAGILRASCEAGELRFDLEPEALLLYGEVEARRVACDTGLER
jgi:hypothetical protein